ncbi:dTMP kinase [Streptomyces sp. NPDC014676]|uniref:dTMP kinase n=1 Tax=Streptomyces sp. NPDC014676 TaxID=3364879 RepID=UPI0036FF4963
MTHLPPPYQPFSYSSEPYPAIVLEGVSGIGKSTLADLLTKQLKASGLHTLPDPHTGWSPTANSKLRSLPQFAFYLSGLLHASDRLRVARVHGPVVADRYLSSIIACHSAVHHVPVDVVTDLVGPFRSYLETPTRTYYLRCSEEELRTRITVKTDVKSDDTDLFEVPGRLSRLLANFAQVAAADQTAVWVETDGRTPQELADWIIADLELNHA